MKILYFVHGFPPSIGPGAINAYKIAEHLSYLGHEIMVLSPGYFSRVANYNDLKIFLDVKNLNVKFSSYLIKKPFNQIISHYENIFKFLFKFSRNFKPNLILSQYSAFHYASVAGNHVSKICKIPHVIRSHDIFFTTSDLSLPLQIFYSMFYPKIYKSVFNSKIFYVVCSELEHYMKKIKKYRNLDIRVNHNGIDKELFYPYKNQDKLKSEFGCDKIISYIGILSNDTGLQYFVHCLPTLFKSQKDTKVLIIGDGPAKDYIINFLKKNNLENKVYFYGLKSHNEIPFYINNSDIGIGRITSNLIWKYSIPIKCLEYLACKKTFITTPISKDLIKNDDVGLVLNKNFTEKEIIEKTNMLLEDKELRRKLGENGYNIIHKKFLWENIIQNLDKDIKNLS